MVELARVQKQADELSQEDRQSLLAYLIHGLRGFPQGPDEAELARRDAEMDSGKTTTLGHDEFVRQVRGR